jgi:hypothetical protein
MATPPEVRSAEELRVDGLSMLHGGLFVKEDFTIGEYAVSHVERGASSQTRYPTLLGSARDEASGYSYRIAHGAEGLHGECWVEASENKIQLGKMTLRQKAVKMGCACSAPEDPKDSPEASVVLEAHYGDYGGALSVRGAPYRITAIYETQGGGRMPFTPAGYRVDADDFVGAVDILHPGHVWIDKGLDPSKRDDVACVFAGLLLYVLPSD